MHKSKKYRLKKKKKKDSGSLKRKIIYKIYKKTNN